MADCASGLGKCTFGDTGPIAGQSTGGDSTLTKRTYLDNWRRVSGLAYNCTGTVQRRSLTWTQTTGTTDTFGVSFKVEIGTIFKASIETKYEHQWLKSVSYSDTWNDDVRPGYIGWIERAQVMNSYTGKWRTHYDDPKWGHYYWATPYDTVTSPANEGEDGWTSNIKWQERPMTRDELISNCGWDYPPQSIAGGTTLKSGWSTQASLTRLVMQSDGNLVMYRLRDGAAIWSTHTSGHPGAYAVMQTDGNFVVYDAANRFLWNSNTVSPGAWAILQNDGNFVVYKSTGGPGVGGALWASNTTAAAK
ncbi:hypothetical protein [Streptomyces sp. NPDC058466]|uniref:hypothetical protein n=1 Tax=Streptomyces sp. NPDC058466 TaxID=3346512 RepID=UPI00366509B8